MKIYLYEVVSGREPENIGPALFDAVPPVGAILAGISPGRPVCWRVVAVAIDPTAEGSMNAAAHARGERVQLAHVEVFVVADVGPHDVDAYERFVGEEATR